MNYCNILVILAPLVAFFIIALTLLKVPGARKFAPRSTFVMGPVMLVVAVILLSPFYVFSDVCR